jgi:hypothetical protein
LRISPVTQGIGNSIETGGIPSGIKNIKNAGPGLLSCSARHVVTGPDFFVFCNLNRKGWIMESIMNEELRGTETVLVVDDEPEILHAAGILLGILGYVVFLAIKGEHALETCRKCRISLVIIDPEAYMVGMDGYEVIGRMKEIRPELRFLIMSGQDR